MELCIEISMIKSRISKVSHDKGNRYRMLMVHSIMSSSLNMWESLWIFRNRYWLLIGEVSRSCLHSSRTIGWHT
jgi:hypothetical protein